MRYLYFFSLLFLTSNALPRQNVGQKIRALGDKPTKVTGDTREIRVVISKNEFKEWETSLENEGLLEFYDRLYDALLYWWDRILYGGDDYKKDGTMVYRSSLAQIIDYGVDTATDLYKRGNGEREPPLEFNMLLYTWLGATAAPLISIRPERWKDPPPNVPSELQYPVDMLNEDFDGEDQKAEGDETATEKRTTADHLRLLSKFYIKNNFKCAKLCKWNKLARYFANAEEVLPTEVPLLSGENSNVNLIGPNFISPSFRDDEKITVDPNKTTRIRNTLLTIRDHLIADKLEASEYAWELVHFMGTLDKKFLGYEDAEQDRMGWEALKKDIVQLPKSYRPIINLLDAMSEVLRVLEPPPIDYNNEESELIKFDWTLFIPDADATPHFPRSSEKSNRNSLPPQALTWNKDMYQETSGANSGVSNNFDILDQVDSQDPKKTGLDDNGFVFINLTPTALHRNPSSGETKELLAMSPEKSPGGMYQRNSAAITVPNLSKVKKPSFRYRPKAHEEPRRTSIESQLGFGRTGDSLMPLPLSNVEASNDDGASLTLDTFNPDMLRMRSSRLNNDRLEQPSPDPLSATKRLYMSDTRTDGGSTRHPWSAGWNSPKTGLRSPQGSGYGRTGLSRGSIFAPIGLGRDSLAIPHGPSSPVSEQRFPEAFPLPKQVRSKFSKSPRAEKQAKSEGTG